MSGAEREQARRDAEATLDPNRIGPGAPFLAGHILALLDEAPEPDQFCGRTDLGEHRPHSWRRLPDGSYGDYDDEGDMIWCPGGEKQQP